VLEGYCRCLLYISFRIEILLPAGISCTKQPTCWNIILLFRSLATTRLLVFAVVLAANSLPAWASYGHFIFPFSPSFCHTHLIDCSCCCLLSQNVGCWLDNVMLSYSHSFYFILTDSWVDLCCPVSFVITDCG
jgi:hypothetical protein